MPGLVMFVLLFVMATGLSHQAPSPAIFPAAEGALVERVDHIFAAWDRKDSPGCALAVMRDGRVIYQRGYGMAVLEQGVPNTPATVFNTGSMAKQFTAFCVLLLAEDGKLTLDDDVRKYVPDLPDYGEPLTLRHLLHHTSGLREFHNLLTFAGWRWGDLITEGDALTILHRQHGLNFRPGEEFMYSNSNYVLLAVVIKRASGQSLREFAAKRVFQPLGMTHTQVVEDYTAAVPGRAAGHSRGAAGGYDVERLAYNFNGPANVLSTVEDLAKWDENFYTPKVGGPDTIKIMTTPGRLKSGTTIGYCSGLFLGTYRALPIVSHAGSSPGFRSDMIRFPAQHFSVVVLGNLFDMSATRLCQQVADVYLADSLPKEDARKPAAQGPAAAPAVDPAPFAGLYWNERRAASHRFAVQKGQLHLLTNEGPYALVAIGPTEFQLPVAPRRFVFTFIPGDAKQPTRVRENIEGQAPVEYTLTPEAKPTVNELAVYAGAYRSDELDRVWSLVVHDNQLFMHQRKFRDTPLKPIVADVFESGAGIFQFQRASDGRVTGFTITTERVRNLRFMRIEY